ncbi:MAG: M55 family metallopeptidase [Gemmatimonadales bacterium]
MTHRLTLLMALAAFVPAAEAQAPRGARVFISIDMEGLAGVVNGRDVDPAGPDYGHFRTIMAGEANAAIEGAFRAGATDVVVRDSHGAKNNLLPGDLDPRARLLRGVSTGPRNMMEGIDSTFDAVVFLGYHARAGTPNAILEHTSTGNVVDFAVNGISLPEAGYNAVVAGLAGVPVVFIAGDQAVVDQVRELLGAVDGVATKREINDAALSLSPQAAREAIQRGVEAAVRNRSRFRPYRIPGPYSMVLKVRKERPLYPGSRRIAEGEIAFASQDFLEVLNAFNAMK